MKNKLFIKSYKHCIACNRRTVHDGDICQQPNCPRSYHGQVNKGRQPKVTYRNTPLPRPTGKIWSW